MRIRMPKLQADCKTLLDLYVNNLSVTPKQIQAYFEVSPATASMVVKYIHKYAEENNIEVYSPRNNSLIPTDLLFMAYGWDVDKLKKRAKLMS